MLVADMMHSCSNDKIAKTAVACIGGEFADRVHARASENGLNPGKYVSAIVQRFARRADGDAYATLQQKMAGTDQPVLQGLRYIVESTLDDCPLYSEGDPYAAAASAAGCEIFNRPDQSRACHSY